MKSSLTSALSFLLFGLVACSSASSDPTNAPPDEGNGNSPSEDSPAESTPGNTEPGKSESPSEAPAALTCASYGLCTNQAVAVYHGIALPPATGGKLKDGMYRIAYVLDPKGTGVGENGERSNAIIIRGSQFLTVGDSLASTGTFETKAGSVAEITFKPSATCDSGLAAKKDGDARPAWTRRYAVDAEGRLTFYAYDNTVALVYLPVSKLCGMPDAIPAKPGESTSCTVSNCGCSESANGAANANVCKFISGG